MSWDLTLPPLKQKFAQHFMMGNIISPWDFEDEKTLEMFLYHYNSVTAENMMKPMHITSAPGVYDFEQADRLADWACKHGISLIGHTLIWHGQSAPWLNRDEQGNAITRAAAKANMQAFISEYAGRYAGRVYSWDVMNEIFRDINEYSGNWREHLRRNESKVYTTAHWYLAYENGAAAGECGSDYVFDAFYFTRKADPKAILYYNDYNEDVPAKRDAIADMVEDINAQWQAHAEYDGRLLIEGIGMQSHHNDRDFSPENVRAAIKRYAETGAKLAITELDFTYGTPEAPAAPLTEEQAQAQAESYRVLFALYREFSENIERVTFWAKCDGQSWRKWGSPVLFDENGTAKKAYHAI